MTDARIVKNFLVVVMMEQVNGPNVVTVTKMKCCEEIDTPTRGTVLIDIARTAFSVIQIDHFKVENQLCGIKILTPQH